jgi:hypothetical protein
VILNPIRCGMSLVQRSNTGGSRNCVRGGGILVLNGMLLLFLVALGICSGGILDLNRRLLLFLVALGICSGIRDVPFVGTTENL